jgi:hypothetical protein
VSNLEQVHPVARACGTFDLEVVAVITNSIAAERGSTKH